MKIKQTLSLILSLLLFASSLAFPIAADEGDNDTPFIEPTTEATLTPEGEKDPTSAEGISFDALGSYPLTKGFSENPRTFEAEIFLSESQKDSAGVIFSNEDDGGTDAYLTVSIFKNGVPRVTYKSRDGISYDYRFDLVDVRGEEWVHLSIVLEEDGSAMHCYLNGVLAQTLTEDRSGKPSADYHPAGAVNAFYIGGDATENNPNYFKGAMRSLAVFSKPRTAEQLRADVTDGISAADTTLLCAYAMRAASITDGIKDLSSNRNDAESVREWFSAPMGGAYTGAYDYSLAVVGDTQMLTYHGARNSAAYVNSLENLYKWILDHAEEKQMQYVLGLGDITEKGEDWGHKNNDTEAETAVGDAEWAFAREAISLMDGKIPYTLIRGAGHDGRERFNEWFAGHEGYTRNIAGYYKDGRIENVYHTFTAGETDYLILCLDFGAKDDVLEWANALVAAHPDHRVIVTTHGYMEKDGTHLETGEEYCPSKSYYDPTNNDGDDIWAKFVSKHENIFLVLSGHMSADEIVINQRKGDAGNTVTEMLIDPQTMDSEYAGGTGMVAMLYFSHDSDIVGVEYYSTNMNGYRLAKTFDINHTHAYVDTVVPPTCEHYGYTSHICACGSSLANTNLVPKLPHTYGDAYDADCNVCGEVREVEEAPTEEAESESFLASEEEEQSSAEPELKTEPQAPTEDPTSDASSEDPSEELPSGEAESTPSDGGGDEETLDSGLIIAIAVIGGVAILGGGAIAIYGAVSKKKK